MSDKGEKRKERSTPNEKMEKEKDKEKLKIGSSIRSTSTKDNLMLAAKMGKPSTPSFSAEKNGDPHSSPSPSMVVGVRPVTPVKDPRVDALISTVELQQKQFAAFMKLMQEQES